MALVSEYTPIRPNGYGKLLPSVLDSLHSLPSNGTKSHEFNIGSRGEYRGFVRLHSGAEKFSFSIQEGQGCGYPKVSIMSEFELIDNAPRVVGQIQDNGKTVPLILRIAKSDDELYSFYYRCRAGDTDRRVAYLVHAYAKKGQNAAKRPLSIKLLDDVLRSLGPLIPKSIDFQSSMIRLLNVKNVNNQQLTLNEYSVQPLVPHETPDTDAYTAAQEHVLF